MSRLRAEFAPILRRLLQATRDEVDGRPGGYEWWIDDLLRISGGSANPSFEP